MGPDAREGARGQHLLTRFSTAVGLAEYDFSQAHRFRSDFDVLIDLYVLHCVF